MDYEKKYNEALERAKKIHDEILNNELLGFPDQIREIFPELRGSEDERIMEALVWHLKAGEDFVSKGVTKEECITYLVKQKEQKPAWSEEDKTHLNWIIECLGSWKYQVPEFADQYQSAIDFLKSLRPSWKPSEEQMQALEFVIKDYREDGCIATANYLQEILDQIKKL